MNRQSAVIARREKTEGRAATTWYCANLVYGTALVGLVFEASEEQAAWSAAAAVCRNLGDLGIDATIRTLVKVILQ